MAFFNCRDWKSRSSRSALIGADALRALGATNSTAVSPSSHFDATAELPSSIADLIPEIAAQGKGVIMTMGKGGVGKTTVAAALAVGLARLGHSVHLTTTDPAAHLTMAVEGGTPGLTVSRIDPAAETRAYTEEVLRESGEGLDEKGPCAVGRGPPLPLHRRDCGLPCFRANGGWGKSAGS